MALMLVYAKAFGDDSIIVATTYALSQIGKNIAAGKEFVPPPRI